MADSSPTSQYQALLSQVVSQLDALIYDIENEVLSPLSTDASTHDIRLDAIPILRKLKDARKQANHSRCHYESC